MALELTLEAMRELFSDPNDNRAPEVVLKAFVDKQNVLDRCGVNGNVNRLAFFFANIAHECGGFGLKGLSENLNYSHERVPAVWPTRFSSAFQVRARFGTEQGWQLKMFDEVYGNRMGNRPGTNDGSRYIGRGGPQWTGRDGYQNLERITGIQAVDNPGLVTTLELQPEICCAFWEWKNMNVLADAGDFRACVRRWNGGAIGLADRQRRLARMLPIIRKLGPRKKVTTTDKIVATTGVVSAGVGAVVAQKSGWGPMEIVMTVAAIVLLTLAAYLAVKWFRARRS